MAAAEDIDYNTRYDHLLSSLGEKENDGHERSYQTNFTKKP